MVARVRPAGAPASWTPPSAVSGLRALAAPSTVDRAAAPFRTRSVEVVAFASTSSGYVLGHLDEAALVESLRQSCGVPVVASSSSAVEALRACGSRRVLLVHPPWFDDEVDALGSRYFRDQGFEVSLVKASGLPDDPGAVRPGQVVDWVLRHVGDEADAVFLAVPAPLLEPHRARTARRRNRRFSPRTWTKAERRHAGGPGRDELYAEAARRKVRGRSRMTKAQLQRALSS